jgi:hypothetical protein
MEVQHITGRSQPSLCYDIKRIKNRLRFIFYLNSVADIFMDFIREPPKFFTPFEIEVMTLMFYTSSFTLASEIFSSVSGDKVPQVKVRYTLDRCLGLLEHHKLWGLYEIFVVIRENLNIIRRASWSDGVSKNREVFLPR